ncbi:MAG: beta-N-acetylhexosaminidase [Janthinobacterium lividum]
MSFTDSLLDNSFSLQANVIPKPNTLVQKAGFFRLTPETKIAATEAAHGEARLLADRIAQATGFSCPITELRDLTAGRIEIVLNASLIGLGSEGYRLQVTPHVVTIAAPCRAGLFYGVQTLLQLLPSEIFRASIDATQNGKMRDWVVPCVDIEDAPRFDWRGVMLDVARHFLPIEFLYKLLDTIALHKMNVLQLHLTDDQGWRIEIKKYPKLTQIGGYRSETLVGYAQYSPTHANFDPSQEKFDHTPHGGWYTQSEMRDLVDYARQRHITIVPEIEMPGHAQAAVAAYPELGCTEKQIEVSPRWGIHDVLFRPFEPAFSFLQDVLTEIADIFPSPYIHVGGDEALKTQWRSSPECQQLKHTLGLPDENALQSYFIGRVNDFLIGLGRVLVGWDEILEGGLSAGAVVMSWRGEQGGVTAAEQGHDVIMAPYQFTYFDYYQSEEYDAEPPAFPETLTLPTVYHYEPVPATLLPEHEHHVLGAQCQLWSEYMPDAQQVEYMAFPRLAAFSELTWTRLENKNFDSFCVRLHHHLTRLDALNVNYRPLNSQTMNSQAIAPAA